MVGTYYFENMNVSNQSRVKNNKRIDKIQYYKKKKSLLNKVEHEMLRSEMNLYIQESVDKDIDLTLENDTNFKIMAKETTVLEDEYCSGRNVNREPKILELDKSTNLYNNNDTTIKNNASREINMCVFNKEQSEISSSSHQQNEFKNDLQSLLIMMTINSNLDENAVPNHIKEISVPQETNFTELKKSFETKSASLIPLLNVISLQKEFDYREKYIGYKYLKKWKMFINYKKENKTMTKRKEALDRFFEKLSKKKNNGTANEEIALKANNFAKDYNTYQHRYKVQKHIIALQKSKLEEQNKLIEQLKYNKIVEASRQSLDTMRDDVRTTYYDIDRHLRPKIKCLTNEFKIKEIEEPSLVPHCLKVPQFLQRMEARAREREEKHAMIRERRKQLEEERIKQKQQAEIARAEMDKEEKVKRIRELREKRKKEKIENIRKKQHAEKLRALIVMADLHYERSLMNKYGITPLRYLIEIKRDNIEKAKAHYRFQLLKNVFFKWMWHTEDMWFDRNYKAEDFYRKKILKKSFACLKKNHHEYILKKQVAEDYYDLYVTQAGFIKFREGIEISKKELELKWKKAELYHNSIVLFRTFTCWRTLPALNALKREQDIRKLRWREKVLLVVPDYKPPED